MRATTDEEDRFLANCPLPKEYTQANWELDPANPFREGIYLGVVRTQAAADTTNSGIITTDTRSSFKAGHNDYFLYDATTTSGNTRRRGYIYRWSSIQNRWDEQARPTKQNPQNASLYWEVINDLTANVNDMYVSTAFIRSLIADEAFIRYLFAEILVLNDGGRIQSSGFNSVDTPNLGPPAGFRILHNGSAEFNNVKIIGHVEATSGSFRGHIEATSGTFKGAVEMSMSQFGTTYPLIGGLRGFCRGLRLSGTNYSWMLSSNIISMTRVSTGRFEMVLSPNYPTGLDSAVINAFLSVDTSPNTGTAGLIYRGVVIPEISGHYYYSMINNHPGDFMLFDFRNSSGTMIDPVKIDILFIG